MSIVNTQTQEFDWTSYGNTVQTARGEQFQFISDSAHKLFEDAGGVGHESNAHKNFRAINRVLSPGLDVYGAAITGGVTKDSNGETFLSHVDTGNFQSDGMYWPSEPLRSSDSGTTLKSSPVNVYNHSQIVTYHSKNPDGIPVGTFVPLMMWKVGGSEIYRSRGNPYRNLLATGNKHWDTITDIDSTYDAYYEQLQGALVDEGNLVYGLGQHCQLDNLRTVSNFRDCIAGSRYAGDGGGDIRSQAHVSRNTSRWGNSLNHRYMAYGRYASNYTYYYKNTIRSMSRECVLWYAHDGEGNGMMVMTYNFGSGTASTGNPQWFYHEMYGHYNDHFASTNDSGSVATPNYLQSSGYQSGMYSLRFPRVYTSLSTYGTSQLLYDMAKLSEQHNTRWLIDPINPELNLVCGLGSRQGNLDNINNWTGYKGVHAGYLAGIASPGHETSHGYHTGAGWDSANTAFKPSAFAAANPYIVCFPTKMGTRDQAALKTPVNLYMSTGLNKKMLDHPSHYQFRNWLINHNIKPGLDYMMCVIGGSDGTNTSGKSNYGSIGNKKPQTSWQNLFAILGAIKMPIFDIKFGNMVRTNSRLIGEPWSISDITDDPNETSKNRLRDVYPAFGTATTKGSTSYTGLSYYQHAGNDSTPVEAPETFIPTLETGDSGSTYSWRLCHGNSGGATVVNGSHIPVWPQDVYSLLNFDPVQLQPCYIASSIGEVAVHRVTCGAQEPTFEMNGLKRHTGARADTDSTTYGDAYLESLNMIEPVRFLEFPGVTTSYNAIKSTDYSEAAGNLINRNGAWSNPQGAVDTSNNTYATCTKTGFENAMAVRLTGEYEGGPVELTDPVRRLILNVGGIKKLVLGPQQLKIAIYTNANGDLGSLITEPVVFESDGSDLEIGSRQIVFDQTRLIGSPTYEDVKNAWVAFWVETPS
jgi:hypothetical protein